MTNELITVEELSKSILEDCEKIDKKYGLKEGTSSKITSLQLAAYNGFPVTREEMLDTFMEAFVETPEVKSELEKH